MNLINMTANDLPLLEQWLDSEHVYRWFGEPEFWLTEFDYEPNSFFMVEHEGEKIGFCRYTAQIPLEYVSFFSDILLHAQEKTLERQGQTQDVKRENQCGLSACTHFPIYFVDYGIGSLVHLGKGLGKKMLELLCAKVAEKNDCVLVATSSLKNIASCSILKQNGFYHDEQSNLFLKLYFSVASAYITRLACKKCLPQ